MVILYVPYYITLTYRFHFTDWGAPIQSIAQYANFPLRISVLGMVGLNFLVQLLTAVVMTSVIIWLSILCQKQTITLLIGTLIEAVPFVFCLLSAKFLESCTFVTGFVQYHLLANNSGCSSLILYLAALFVVESVVMVRAYQRYCG